MTLWRAPLLSAEPPLSHPPPGTPRQPRRNRPMTERSVNIASQWEALRGRKTTAEVVAAAAAATETRRKRRRRRREEVVESKWTNISQMVALLFVTVAAEGGGARARSATATARMDSQKPRHRQNAIEENRGRFSPQIANGAWEIKTCLSTRSHIHPNHSRPRPIIPSLVIPATSSPSDMNLTTTTTTSLASTNNNSPASSPLLHHKDSSGKMSPVTTALPLPLLKPNPAAIFSALQQQQQQPLPQPPGSPPTTTTAPAPLPMATLPPPPPSIPAAAASADQIRLQQLYTLALADRMRFLHPAALLSPYSNTQSSPPPPPGSPSSPIGTTPPRGLPPPDFHHPLYPYGKFDPRLFRLPEEPKPQHSYIGLISMAILSSAEHKLVLADIYQYILDNFPYFRHRGPGWRNSIRHNLSLNDCFIKSGRAANGKGHYWAIHPACTEDFKKGDYRRRKAQRKVRRHMGLAVDEEDSPSPPPPPQPLPPPHGPMFSPAGVAVAAAAGWPFPFSHQAAALAALHARAPVPPPPHPHPHPPGILPPNLVAPIPLPPPLNLRPVAPPSPPPLPTPLPSLPTPQSKTSKRQFDVASLLGNNKTDEEEDEEGNIEGSHGVTLAEKRMRRLEQITAARGLFRPPPDDDPKDGTASDDEGNENCKTHAASESDDENEEAPGGGGGGGGGGGADKENHDTDSAGEDREKELRSGPIATPSFSWPLPASTANGSHPLPQPPPPLPAPPQPLVSNGLPAHEYLARYYQLMQQNQQRMQGAVPDDAAANAGDDEEK